jgi:fructokinase
MTSTAVCLGEALIDFVPTEGGLGLARTDAFKKAAGGAPANVAVGLARLGVPTAFMGMVGDDPFGTFLRDTLAETGVEVRALRRTDAAPTTIAFVSLDEHGEREFMFYRNPGADTLLRAENIDAALIREARVLHFGSLGLVSEPSRSATLHAAALARDADTLLSYDANLRLPLWPGESAARQGLMRGFEQANIAKVSEDELRFLTGCEALSDGIRQIWHPGLALLVVTLGSHGSLFASADAQGSVASFDVTCVDTTGAGDGFMAGLLAALLDDPEALHDSARLSSACRFANAVGALATTVRGAIPAMPARETVQQFLLEH